MNRTQIYLPKTQISALRKEAQKRNTTVSDVIRNIINEKLEAVKIKAGTGERLLAAAGRINRLGKNAPKDLASRLDKYLYG